MILYTCFIMVKKFLTIVKLVNAVSFHSNIDLFQKD